jgi:glycerol-3-phosphate dehydrogenase (NAD(P)+)
MITGSVSVLGGGSFGTVIANIVAENGFRVNFWMRSEALVAQVNLTHENPAYLPGYPLHPNVVAYHDMASAITDSDLVFVAVPSAYFRAVVRDMLQYARPNLMLVSLTKGI